MAGRGYAGGGGGRGGPPMGGRGGGGRGGGRGGGAISWERWTGETEIPGPVNPGDLPANYVGPFTWSGKDKEANSVRREQDGEQAEEAALTGEFTDRRPLPPAKVGAPINVVCNFTKLDITGIARHLWRVDFSPEVQLTNRRKYLVAEALGCKKDGDRATQFKYTYDGVHQVYTQELIDNKKELTAVVPLSITREQTENITVTLKWTGHQVSKLNKETIQFFCQRFKSGMSRQTDRKAIGSDYFDMKRATPFPEYNCQLVPGLDCTVYLTQCGALLSTDMMYKHIRTDTVWDLMVNMKKRNSSDLAINTTFSHVVVMLSYGNQKTYIIDKVRFDLTPASKFLLKKTGKEITYADYFKEQYDIQSMDMSQPLLECQSRRERDTEGNLKISHFIPSLCHLTGATDEMKNDKTRCRELIKKTALPPAQRLSAIYNNVVGMIDNEAFKSELEPWGIKMSKKLVEITARRLPSPSMKHGGGLVEIKPNVEAWDVNWPMHRAAQFENWALICPRATPELRGFLDTLYKKANELRIKMNPLTIFDTRDSVQPKAYLDVINTQVGPKNPSFVMCAIPGTSQGDAPYKQVKKLLCEVGVPSQMVSLRTVGREQKLLGSICNKVVVQMNCKAMGAPWTVDMKLGAPTMFVGLSVTHSGDLEHKQGSRVGLVCTTDRECTRFYSRDFMVKPKQSYFVPMAGQPSLKQLVMDAITEFKATNNGVAPKFIVVYRDGGSEGELEMLSRHEVQEFRGAIADQKIECALTFFVVLKKIRTRFFVKNPANPGEVANPYPGSCIDTHIVSNFIPEFYICCQSVNQGSATPTKYQKIFDNSTLNADTLQMYTYCLSHLYFNWPGTVRTPMVCHYASKLAEFTGKVGQKANAKLYRSLYYL